MARRSKTPAAQASAPPPLVLPSELTIYTVGELHPQWLAWLSKCIAGDAALPVDAQAEVQTEVQAAAVDQIDAAGLQLLLALQRSLAEGGRRLAIAAPSQVLCRGCDSLGLGDWLRAHASEPAGVAA